MPVVCSMLRNGSVCGKQLANRDADCDETHDRNQVGWRIRVGTTSKFPHWVSGFVGTTMHSHNAGVWPTRIQAVVWAEKYLGGREVARASDLGSSPSNYIVEEAT